MTNSPSVACGPSPAPTNPAQTQLLGLEWSANVSAPTGYDNVVSYVSVPVVNPRSATPTYKMLRQVCSYSSGSALTLKSTITVAQNISSAGPDDHRREQREHHQLVRTNTGRVHPHEHLRTTSDEPVRLDLDTRGDRRHLPHHRSRQRKHDQRPGGGSTYTYTLTGLPGESTSQGSASSLTTPGGAGCGFAAAGSGFYSNKLCFADFTGLNNPPTQYSASNPSQCQTMSRPIANTPYTLSFCIALSGTNVSPSPIPTYYSPQGDSSEAYLGNNGFYTGIPGNPALYQTGGGITTAYFTNIQVLDAAGQPATGWTLVTGDAESTDSGEWMVFSPTSNGRSCRTTGRARTSGATPATTRADAGNNGALQYTGAMPPSDATRREQHRAPVDKLLEQVLDRRLFNLCAPRARS